MTDAAEKKQGKSLHGWNLQVKRYKVVRVHAKHPPAGTTTIWDQWGQTTWRNRETGRHLSTKEIEDLVHDGALVELDLKGNPVPVKPRPVVEVLDAGV